MASRSLSEHEMHGTITNHSLNNDIYVKGKPPKSDIKCVASCTNVIQTQSMTHMINENESKLNDSIGPATNIYIHAIDDKSPNDDIITINVKHDEESSKTLTVSLQDQVSALKQKIEDLFGIGSLDFSIYQNERQ